MLVAACMFMHLHLFLAYAFTNWMLTDVIVRKGGYADIAATDGML